MEIDTIYITISLEIVGLQNILNYYCASPCKVLCCEPGCGVEDMLALPCPDYRVSTAPCYNKVQWEHRCWGN